MTTTYIQQKLKVGHFYDLLKTLKYKNCPKFQKCPKYKYNLQTWHT